jgi:Zn-finger nucleic acid-binding protein
MQCPLCIDETLEPRFHGRVEIDVCPRCRGVWLDRGELDKLVEPLEAPPLSTRRPETDDDRRDDDRPRSKKGKKKRKKSFGERLGDVLEDVLDFD